MNNWILLFTNNINIKDVGKPSMPSLEDRIAELVCAQFEELPAKSRPTVNGDGTRGWVPLSGIVVIRDNEEAECVALATGMKCMPSSKIPQARGFVLHDWHAEILAIRGFNAFLIQECHSLANSPGCTSPYIRHRVPDEISNSRGLQPFTLQENLKIQMYCSEAPCGDASMELVMSAQEDSTPWPVPIEDQGEDNIGAPLNGRGYFSQLGRVRRKPSRPDSPPTLSKSCSDKLALKQCTSLLSSLASLLVSPENVYIDKLILPSSHHVPTACERAFGATGRMQPLTDKQWAGGYRYHPFEIQTAEREFRFSQRGAEVVGQSLKASNISALWTPRSQETLINGVLQGRKQIDPRGASSVCRLKTWRAVLDIAALLAIPALTRALSSLSYAELKDTELLKDRRRVKEETRELALAGWIRNVGGNFELPVDRDAENHLL
ncbi:hypothetical protein MMC30_001359 [Trapelia coarctata]|nr:hypothetical protein [Trapelia coarctata]